MNFYIDESGHTGTNLFDPDQPILSYGKLSSPVDLDAAAIDRVEYMRSKLGVHRLHANQLGFAGISTISQDLVELQRAFGLEFGIYHVVKPDHAVISFFDQVFDSGMNPAITWSGYWSPLRYLLLLKLAPLFDEDLASLAWSARIELDEAKAEVQVATVCAALLERVKALPDKRARLLITDTLSWAENNASALSYNVHDRRSILQVAPNIVGFQLVMMGIAEKIRVLGAPASRIVVDRQSQFNKAQRTLADFYSQASKSGVKLEAPPGMSVVDFTNMPTVPIQISGGNMSAGLELTDIYLWVFKRMLGGVTIPSHLVPLITNMLPRTVTDEVSLRGIAIRFEKTMRDLPELKEMSNEQLQKGRELTRMEEHRRLERLGRVPPAQIE